MGLVDDLVEAVEGTGAGAVEKGVVVGFLRGAGMVVEGLGPEAFRAVMGAIAEGSDAGFPAEIVGGLNEDQVLALLADVEEQMGAAVDRHAAEMKARAAALEVLKEAALGVVARVVVGMI